MAVVKGSYFQLAVGFTYGARVVNVYRHLSPFLRGDKLLSAEKWGFTWGCYSVEETLRDLEELHQCRSVTPPGCLKTAPVGAGNLEFGISRWPLVVGSWSERVVWKVLMEYQRSGVGWRY